jgi:hypothetical protein
VVVVGLTLTPTPLVTARLPGVITPVPLAKTAVRVVLPPAAIIAGIAPKLVIEGEGVAGVDDPPQPAKTPKPELRATAHAA